MTTPTGGGSDNPPDDTTIAEIEDAGIAPLREAADDTESLVQLLEAYQQAPEETPEDIIDRMPEPERARQPNYSPASPRPSPTRYGGTVTRAAPDRRIAAHITRGAPVGHHGNHERHASRQPS